jgi:hypothetical protein
MGSTRAVRYCRCGTRLARDNMDTLSSFQSISYRVAEGL